MKLQRVALHGFLSHSDTDWSPNGARLVSLVGANGAGKSSLLDGVAYALFDAARGRTDDLVKLGATDMSALVEFDYAGARYRVARGRTTRAGGKSYLELHVEQADGTWRPLTAASIRETQAAIESLLRVDGATFANAVLLMQGKANAFAEATAAERKRVLATVLGLDVWQRAELVARDRSLELAQEQRDQASRGAALDEALARLPDAREAMALRGADVGRLESEIAAANEQRAVANARLQELAASLATGEAAEADVARLEAEIVALMARYKRAEERVAGAVRIMRTADAILKDAAAVDAAAIALPGLREAVERLEVQEAQAVSLDERIRREQDAHRDLTAAFERDYAAWQANRTSATRAVDDLAAAVTALAPVTCPKCGESIVIDQADLQGKLTSARHALRDLEAAEPKAPAGSLTSKAALGSLVRQRERIGDVRPALNDAREELRRNETQAARAEAMAQARHTLAQGADDHEAALTDQHETTDAGRAARAALVAAQTTVAALDGLRAERTAATEQLVAAVRLLPELARQHTDAIADVGRLRASIDQLEALEAERTALATAQVATTHALSVEKRLAKAFGVTGIPARIIESVLPELTALAQEVLGQLRPGMALSLRAQRATRDGKGVIEALDLIVQDGAGERGLAMFSGGEKTSVSLALAVGLSRLVARRAGAALKTLVVDEPDGLDASARRAFGQSLQILAHNGSLDRVVVVSHHEDLAEMADESFVVTKGPQGSVVELVA